MQSRSLVRVAAAAMVAIASMPVISHAQAPLKTDGVLAATFPLPTEEIHAERYVLPAFCLITSMQAADSVRWGKRADTLPLVVFDTLPPVTIARARQCLGRFPIATIEPDGLSSIVTLAAMTGNDSIVEAAVVRMVSNGPTPQARRERLVVLLDPILTPDGRYRPDLATRITERASEMIRDSSETVVAYMDVYGRLMSTSVGLADWAQFRIAAERFRAAQRRSPFPVIDYSLPGTLADLRIHVSADSARKYYTAMGPTALGAMWTMFRETGEATFARVGLQAPVARAEFRVPSSLQVPADDSVSLLVFVDANCGPQCYGDYWMLRRLAARYPALRIVLMSDMPGAVRSVTGPALARVEAVRRYFQDSLRVASRMLLDTAPTLRRPDPDGRMAFGRSANVMAYFPRILRPESDMFRDRNTLGALTNPLQRHFMLIGRHGKISWIGQLTRTEEPFLMALVDETMAGR